jgi:DNA-binding transcriptional LysR family regulator
MSRDLNDTLIFAKVVEHGSFISAARALRLPKTTVSRKVQELESRLGAQLLHRTTRKLGLTEAGNIYFEHSQRIARELDDAESAIGQLQGGPRGWLRVTAPYSFAISRITPLFGEFQARYPEVRVEMVLTNDTLDLIDKEIDVALRVGPLQDSNLVARRLAVIRSQVYASPRYLERHGEPVHPDDVQHHRTLGMNKYGSNNNGYWWPLNDGSQTKDFRINPVLVANDPAALHPALISGEGLMLTSDVMVKAYAEQGYIRRVLAGWTGPSVELNAVFPRGHGKSPKVRAFVDFLIERVKFDADFMEELCPNHKCCEAELELAAATASASLESIAQREPPAPVEA